MPDKIKFPGVYIQENSSGVHPINGVSTGTAAFVGYTTKGRSNKAVEVLSWKDFETKFGGINKDSPVSYAVQQFFLNGGTNAWIVRVIGRPHRKTPSGAEVTGNYAAKTGMYALRDVDIFNILSIPQTTLLDDAEAREVIAAAIDYCAARRAFYLVDYDPTRDSSTIGGWVASLGPQKDAAVYFPRLLVADPSDRSGNRQIQVSGTIAGLYARTDRQRGVWKAPAGTQADLCGVTGLALNMSGDTVLNHPEINILRAMPGGGIVAWGTRTLEGSDTFASEWKYVPVRRLALFLEESISRGTQWVAFEPNNETLWAQIRLNVGAFMQDLFRQGAFQGSTPAQAYFVKCDNTTTTQTDIDTGMVNIMVGFAPLKQAEFVVLKIRQLTGNVRQYNGARITKLDDLALPAAQRHTMAEIAAQVKKLRPRVSKGQGIAALFTGNSGTEKTMAAGALADGLHLDLYRVDLSQVVSKYIGETEKNLSRLFDRAEQGGAVLFFDEADALFGKRTEVKDNHDRYANAGVNYLLQRIEDYRGLVIVASNMKDNLDPAFLRRLRFVVDFALPHRRRR